MLMTCTYIKAWHRRGRCVHYGYYTSPYDHKAN